MSVPDGKMGEIPGLIIRRFTEEDREPLSALLSDPAVMRFLEPPYTRRQTELFLRTAGLSDPPRVYAAEKDGTFIGYVIFHAFDPESMEIGWVLFPRFQGKGYASALTEQLISKAAAEGKQAVIECLPDHHAVRHIAQRYGFTDTGVREGLSVYRLDPFRPDA